MLGLWFILEENLKRYQSQNFLLYLLLVFAVIFNSCQKVWQELELHYLYRKLYSAKCWFHTNLKMGKYRKNSKKIFIITGNLSFVFTKIICFIRKTGWLSGLRRGGKMRWERWFRVQILARLEIFFFLFQFLNYRWRCM